MDESFSALVRGSGATYPRGFPYLVPVWLVALLGGAGYAWLRVLGPLQWWYTAGAGAGLLIAAITMLTVLATIRQPAFRADRNGIRLGLRTERARPLHRQVHLWWADVRQLRIEPRRYGLSVEISLGPHARIVRRRGPARQALLFLGMLVLPFGLGRGTPRLTEARRKDPQYRVNLYDVTPEQLGLALAAVAAPAVEIIVISRKYGPIMARRPAQPASRPSSAHQPGAGRPASRPGAGGPAVGRPPGSRQPAARPSAPRAPAARPPAAPAPGARPGTARPAAGKPPERRAGRPAA